MSKLLTRIYNRGIISYDLIGKCTLSVKIK